MIIGFGWTGAIMAKTLTDAGLNVVALERGPARDTNPDFQYPRIVDELRHGIRGDLWQPLAKETVTIRHGVDDTAAPYRQYGSFVLVPVSVVRACTGTASSGALRPKICAFAVISRSATARSSFRRT